jgi:hypothetical protein
MEHWSDTFLVNIKVNMTTMFSMKMIISLTQDNWDGYLVNKHNSYDDCGYLCMSNLENLTSWNNYQKTCR